MHERLQQAINAITKRVEEHAEYVAGGKCKDYNDYASVCGHIRGLNSALFILEESLKSEEDEED